MVLKREIGNTDNFICFRSMSYWMVLKPRTTLNTFAPCLRSMSYWMVLKLVTFAFGENYSFRSMSYWMVLKLNGIILIFVICFRSMSYWMVLKHLQKWYGKVNVLDLCHIEWY